MGGLRSRPGRRWVILAVVILCAVVLTGAVVAEVERANPPTGSGDWSPADPNRPVVDLSYVVSSDLRSVTGRERVEFRPDQQVCELVFRAWPNKPSTANAGNALVLTDVRLDSATGFNVLSAGAPAGKPGTLIEVPLAQCVPAGQPIVAELDFAVTLGMGTDERMGASSIGELAWFGTAFPLLAWETGRGWAREEAVSFPGETVTSEEFRLKALQVTAPSQYVVAGVGQWVRSTESPAGGTTTHVYEAEAVRDVTVTVGAVEHLVREVGKVRVHLVAPPYRGRPELQVWADEVESALRRLEGYLGPFPYPELWVSVLPDQSDGIEFPTAVQLGRLHFPADRYIVTHELAHQYFYALVGNNQAADPWLDEAVTTMVQRIVDDPHQDPSLDRDYSRHVASRWGQSMSEWETSGSSAGSQYVDGVYAAGPDALIRARRAAGAASFDAALREYLSDNAHAIATPDDFVDAFADLPDVLEELRDGGAVSGSSLAAGASRRADPVAVRGRSRVTSA